MRPKDADSEQTIAHILRAARNLLEEGGPQALSVRGVARRAKMSVGSVSYYFASLEALSEACLDEHYARLWQRAQRHLTDLADGKPLRDVIRAAARELYHFAREERPLLRLQLATAAQRGGLPARRHQGDQRGLLRSVISGASGLSGVEHAELRIQTLVYTATRFACASVEERCAFSGASSEAEADETIADYLGSIAVALLLDAREPDAVR